MALNPFLQRIYTLLCPPSKTRVCFWDTRSLRAPNMNLRLMQRHGKLRHHPALHGAGSVYPEYRYSKNSTDWVLFKSYIWRAGDKKRTRKKIAEWMSWYQELIFKPFFIEHKGTWHSSEQVHWFCHMWILWWCLIDQQGPLTRTPFLESLPINLWSLPYNPTILAVSLVIVISNNSNEKRGLINVSFYVKHSVFLIFHLHIIWKVDIIFILQVRKWKLTEGQ